ncbi:peptidoglycan DD-metalloendopeptidase family protein [Eubacteriaceae bacterium ES2]|nr:peptidoglycan DD-metalloendopeptidase family protein [Eubacteriaceae bacterium ES2]
MAYDIGLKVGIDGETEFRKSIQNINDEYKTLKTEMTSITSAFDRNDKSQENLTKQIESQRKKLQETTQVLEKTTEEYGKTDKKTLSWQRTVNSTTAELNKLENRLKENNRILAESGNKWTDLSEKIDSSSKKISNVGDAMIGTGGKLTVGLTAPILAASTAIGYTAIQFDNSAAQIKSALGLTEEEAEKFEESIKNVWENGFGESLDDVTNSLFKVKQNMKEVADGEELEKVTQDAITLAGTFDADVNEVTRAGNNLMVNFGVESSKAFDLMAAGAQNGLNFSDEMFDNLSEYSGLFSTMGYSAEEYFQILINGSEAGVYNLDYINDVMKEFQIRVKDGSDATYTAMSQMSSATQEVWQSFLSGNGTVKDVSNTVITELKGMDDQVAANQIGVSLFGTKWEDMESDAMYSLTTVGDEMSNITGVMDKMVETQGDTFGTKWQEAIRQSQEALLPLGETILDIAIDYLPEITESIESATEWFDELSPASKNLAIGLVGVAAAIGPVTTGIGLLTKEVGLTITAVSTVTGAIGVMTTGAAAAKPAIGGLATALTVLTGPVGLVIAGVSVLSVGLIALYEHQKNNTIQTKEQIEENKKFVDSNNAVTESVETNLESRQKSLETTENEVVAAKTLADKIFDLADKQNKSAAEMAALDSFISEFNQIMPDANLLIDEHTGVLNLSRDAVADLIAVEEDRIRIAAVSDLLIQNAKDQLDVTRQLSDAESERNRLQTLENEAVQNAIDQGGTIIQIKERLNKVYDEYGDAITAANESTDTLRGKQTELNTEQDKLNQLVSDPTAWDAYTTNVGTATASTEAYATDANAALERYKQESAAKSEETGYGIGSSTAKGLNDSASTAGDAAQVVHDNVASKLNPLGAFGEKTGGEVNAGLRVGMEDKEAVDKSVGGLVGWVMDAFNIGFDIHSPAKKMYPIGVNVLKGIFSGMNSLDIGAFADSMVQKLLDAFNNGKVTALGIFNSMGEMGSELLEKMGISLGITGGGLPVDGAITSEFGYRPPEETDGKGSTWHAGIDIGAPEGTPIYAVEGGIANLSTGSGYGNLVIIDTGAGIQEYYGHMSGFNVEDGQMVNKGDIIGFVGSTGNSTGPHLHFGVLQNGEWIDPLSLYGFSVGSRYIPYDMPIMVHQGEMIVPRSENPYANSGGQVLPEASSSGSKQPIIIQIPLDKRVIAEILVDSLDDLLGQKSNLAARGMP